MWSPGSSGAKYNFRAPKSPGTSELFEHKYTFYDSVTLWKPSPSVIEEVIIVPLWKTSPSDIDGAFPREGCNAFL